MQEEFKSIIEEGINDIFIKAHQLAKTKSGDETVEMALRCSKIQDDLLELVTEQVNFNL